MVICVGELFGGGIAPILAGAVAQRYGIEHVLLLGSGALIVGFVTMLFLVEPGPKGIGRSYESDAASISL